MRKKGAIGILVVIVAVAAAPGAGLFAEEAAKEWHLNGTIIEACSCPMFCQCYFNTKPAAHGAAGHGHDHGEGGHFCRFNNVVKVNKGNHGSVSLDGARFWVAGDLGGDFAEGKLDWAVVHFDPEVMPEQRQGILAALGPLYPAEWSSFSVGEDKPIEWRAEGGQAVALLDGGKAGEVRLQPVAQAMTDEPVVIKNLTYWGAPRHDGFVLMPNTVEAYRLGPKAFEYQGTNGFMITFDISSKDVAGHSH
jgi:hypothetical protein